MPPKSKAKAKAGSPAAKNNAGGLKRDTILDFTDDPMDLKLPTYSDALRMTPGKISKEMDILATTINKAKENINHAIAETQQMFKTIKDSDLQEFTKFKPPKKLDMNAEAPVIGLVLTLRVCLFLLTSEDFLSSSLEAVLLRITTDHRVIERMLEKLDEASDTGHSDINVNVEKMKELIPIYKRSCFNPNGVGTLVPVAKPLCQWVLTMTEVYWDTYRREQRHASLQALKKAKEALMAKTESGEAQPKWKLSMFKFQDAGGDQMQKVFDNLQALEELAAETFMDPCAHVQVSFKLQDPNAINIRNAELEQMRIKSLLAAVLKDESVLAEDVHVTFKQDGTDGTVCCDISIFQSSVAGVKRRLNTALSDPNSLFYTGAEPAGFNVKLGSSSVEKKRPLQRIIKAVKARYGISLSEVALKPVLDLIDEVQEKYLASVVAFQELQPQKMAELLRFQSKGPYQGKLRAHAEARHAGLREDWIVQSSSSIKDLLESGKKAQRLLKKSIAKESIWAKTEMNDLSLVPLTAQKRSVTFETAGTVAGEKGSAFAFDPGTKPSRKIEEKAAHLNGPYHMQPPYEQVLDLARISQSYDSVDALLAGIRDTETKEEVVFLENHFKAPKGLCYPHIKVGLLLDGVIAEKRLQMREIMIPYPDEHLKRVHELLALQNVGAEHLSGVARTILEELDRTEGEEMRNTDRRAAELKSIMDPVLSQITRVGLLEPHEIDDVQKWVVACELMPVIADIQRSLQNGDLEQLRTALSAADKLKEAREYFKMDCKLLNAQRDRVKALINEIENLNRLAEDARCCELFQGDVPSDPGRRAQELKNQVEKIVKKGVLQPWHPSMLRGKAYIDFLEKLAESVGVDDEIEKTICRQQSSNDLSLSRESVRHRAEQLRLHAQEKVKKDLLDENDSHVARALAVAKEFDILDSIGEFLDDHFVHADFDDLTKRLNDIYGIGKTPLLMKLPLPTVRESTARFRHTSEALLDLHKATSLLDEVRTTTENARTNAIEKAQWAQWGPSTSPQQMRSCTSKPRPRALVQIKRAQLWARIREMERRLHAQAQESLVAEGNPILERAKISFEQAQETLQMCADYEDCDDSAAAASFPLKQIWS